MIDESHCSPVLTSIIEDFILRSALANDYLASQPIIINGIEYSLPLIRNTELENDLLTTNDTYSSTNPFIDFNDLEDYLNRCERMLIYVQISIYLFVYLGITTIIPYHPMAQAHHLPVYYPPYHPISPYYYSSSLTSKMNNYYYNPTLVYPNSQQIYSYDPSTAYYHPSMAYNSNNNNNNIDDDEQFKYYYNSQQQSPYPYPSQTNSTNNIPLTSNSLFHRNYRAMNSNLQR